MTSSSTSVVLLACVFLVIASGVGSAADPPPNRRTVLGLAKVADKTLKTDEGTYYLVAMQKEPGEYLAEIAGTTATRGYATIINGQDPADLIRPAEEGTSLIGKLPRGVWVCWLKLPDEGNVEIISGSVYLQGAGNDPQEVRRRLLVARYVPYVVDVDRIPVAEDATPEKILAALARAATGPTSRPASAPSATAPAKPDAERMPTDRQWGPVTDSYQLSLASDKTTYTPGEPMVLTLKLKNLATTPVAIVNEALLRMYKIEISLQGGRDKMPLTLYGQAAMQGAQDSSRSTESLASGAEATTVVGNLSRIFDMTVSSKYTITVQRLVFKHGDQAQTVEVPANSITVTVEDKPE